MGINWADIKQKTESSVPEIKAQLHPAWVLEHYGHQLNDALATVCPFHDDSDPSLSVYKKDGQWRVGCFPCNKNGDVLDLVGWLEDEDGFHAKVNKAAELLTLFKASKWDGPEVQESARMTFEEAANIAFQSTQGDFSVLVNLAAQKNWPDPAILRDVFEVGVIQDKVIIPHKDRDGNYVGAKWRTLTDKKSVSGSRFEDLYGAWLDQGREHVLVCEGEPDTWASYAALHDRYDVLGLPTGTGTKPRVTGLQGRKVFLALDGDVAGRTATRRWAAALREVGAEVRVAPIPEGKDLSDLGESLESIVESARTILPYGGKVEQLDGVFVRVGKSVEPISNWGIRPTRELRGDAGVAYEGILTTGETALLSGADLADARRLVVWAQERGLSFTGTDRDARHILEWLQSEGPFLAPGNMTSVLGLHDNHFILPDGVIGPKEWVYVPKQDVQPRGIKVRIGEGSLDVVERLLKLHQPAIMHPILAWLAAAPMRSLLPHFPILAVTGSSGAGKSTLIRTCVRDMLGGSLNSLLSGTTPFTITAFCGATNAFPVWFDEYRNGMRQDTKDVLDQTLRAAYDGEPSFKGRRDLQLEKFEAWAPVIITGESAFTETSLVNRMVIVPLMADGRGEEMMRQIEGGGYAPLAGRYLEWLTGASLVNPTPYGPADLSSRARANLGVLKWGWDILFEYVSSHGGTFMPEEPDLSLVASYAQEADRDDPVLQAVSWALEEARTPPIAWIEEQLLHVRPDALAAEVSRHRVFTLPGNSKALKTHLVDTYGGLVTRQRYFGSQFRVVTLDAAVLDRLE